MSERECSPGQAWQDTPEMNKADDFLNKTIDVLTVGREDFLKICKNRWPDKSEEEILQTKGLNFDHEGKVVILIRDDIYPQKYLPYLETHEKWEAFVARKKGYNLFKRSAREYSRDKKVELSEASGYHKFCGDLGVYNYEFRHEYAVLKEYEQALADGKLDEYHNWIICLHEQEKTATDNKDNLKLISNDIKIRESIYQKLKNKKKHYFNRQ